MSTFTLARLRLNFLEILHYLANLLKVTPIFENDHSKIDKNKESGAIFNDFDYQSDELLSSTHIDTVFGVISNSRVRFNENDATFLIPQESVDHAVLETDRHEPFFYNVLSFEHPHYEISSSALDKEYIEKVYNLATGGFKDLPITQRKLEIYEMRQRGEWEGPDSVYDAWLLSNNSRRKWFPYKFFTKIYPVWEQKKNQLFEEKNQVEFCLENQASLYSTVDIDDKSNCRPSSLRSEKKQIMLDTSK